MLAHYVSRIAMPACARIDTLATRPMKRFVLLALLLAGCRRPAPEEQYGFVALLGRDTISVERVTRRGNTVTSDEVDRFPLVRQRHTEVDARRGRRHPASRHGHPHAERFDEQRERRIVADVTKDSVRVTKQRPGKARRPGFATNGGTAMAHVDTDVQPLRAVLPGGAQARRRGSRAAGDTVKKRQFYIDREFDRFPLHHGVVRLLDGTRPRSRTTGSPAPAWPRSTRAYRLLRYSGARHDVSREASRVATPPDIQAARRALRGREAKSGGCRQLSVRDTVRASIGAASFTVDYGRPLARGRMLLGDIIPYDLVWRTGANAATQFTTSAPITLAGLQLPAGGYTLWTVLAPAGVELIVNKQTGQWGTSYGRCARSRRAGR